MARRPTARGVGNAALIALLLGVIVTQGFQAAATHMPADKVVAAASTVDEVRGTTPVLTETMRVSSTSDLILSLTAECALITEVITGFEPGPDTNTSESTAQIRLRVALDDNPVTVSGPLTLQNRGWVVFCNRVYRQTSTDADDDGDIDTLDSYISSRTANAFNWVALDAGKNYDVGDDNILHVKVEAEYVANVVGQGTADAFVGQRSLVIEPTHVSVHETV